LNDGRVVPNFIYQALRGEDLTIYGDGFQTRSFCYIEDLVEGMIRLLLSRENEPVNLGNPQEYSIQDFAQVILQLTGSKSRIIYQSLPTDDPRVRKPDISRAQAVLGWNPKVELKDGIGKTIPYFQKKLEEGK
jgi:dTDP-glucose 4,6-dehydratase